jgi:gas vesicle protein
MDNKETGGFFAGIIVGAMIGVALGFLFAPRAGEETREVLHKKASEAKEKASELSGKLRKVASEVQEKIQI